MLLLFSNCSIDVRDNNTSTIIKDSATTTPSIVYECPMQCENKVFADSGICPICKMELRVIPN
ncbi:MAG: Heavy metal binding domain [Bacteroidota bacterium]